MRCVTAQSGKIVVADRSEPEPGPREILVEVASAGLNNADVLQAAGNYPAPPGNPPDILGLELAGRVSATGPDVTRFSVGDRVMCLVGGGAQAQYAAMDERLAMAVPNNVDLIAAGGFPEAYCTAYDALVTQAGLGTGDRVLVHGATGGVGLAAIRIAVALGASVTACVRTTRHEGMLSNLGAAVVNVDEFVDSGPYDVVLELVGAAHIPRNLEALAPDGRIVVIGTAAGGHLSEVDFSVLMRKRARIFGSTLRARSLERRGAVVAAVEAALVPQLADGTVSIDLFRVFTMEEASSAYATFTQPGKLGKIVVTP